MSFRHFDGIQHFERREKVEKYGEPTPEELAAIKKSHSINIFRLLGLIVLAVAGFIGVFLGILFFASLFGVHLAVAGTNDAFI